MVLKRADELDGARFRDHDRCAAPRSGKIQPRILPNAVAPARAGAAKRAPRHPIQRSPASHPRVQSPPAPRSAAIRKTR